MRLTQMDTILIRMLYLAAAGIVMLTVLGAESVASGLFYLTFILVVLLWCSGAMRNVTWTDAVLILTVGLSLAHVVINAWVEQTAIGFAYFKKYFMFVCTLVYFQAAYKLRPDDRLQNFLLKLNSLLAVFLAVVFAMGSPTLYMIRGRISNYLTFNFTNPNLTALFLACIYTGELLQIFREKPLAGRLWHLLLAAAVGYFVWETESRNCLMTIALETVLCVLLYLRKNEVRLPKWFSFLTAVWPILFAAAYVTFVETPWIREWFSFMTGEGKGLDARVAVWVPALRYYAASPVFGAYSQISAGTGMSQMHNTHLDILVSYGTVVLILVCYLLYSVMRGSDSADTKEETMAKICFAGTIIMGMGEAALFSGGLGIYIFVGLFLLLCNREREATAKNE